MSQPDLEIHRIDYNGQGLQESEVPPAPWQIVRSWVAAARQAQSEQGLAPEPEAISVATADAQGQPTVRTVLMRYLQPDGPGFFTHLDSRKGLDLQANPKIAAALTWPALFRAIRFTGPAELLSREVVETYFQSRPWGSRISAWSSAQSQPVGSRAELHQREQDFAARWPDHGKPDDVPVPERWGGFRVHCDEVELWAGRRSRLHDRLVYVRVGPGGLDTPAAWRIERRQP